MWNIQRDYLPAWGNRSRSSEDDVVAEGEVHEEGPVVAIQAVECGFGAGHTRQVGALDWAADQIVTCSDDYSSRIWKPDPRVGRAMRDRRNGYEYWAGTVKV
ncbi:hypothetical protein QFC21_002706 [Naganishia friedmannii]|uniref:Uncharacterized protein n=1 Tax=Naganishia friedmannii TaxID=89922 RepID=A0ACC2VV54_9TREE|nr:hypothetical protein QFC21_002706 [Naganishia friedmannii]